MSKKIKQTSPKVKKKKPVILQVLPELKSGGVERGTVEIVRCLNDNNFEPLVASAGGHMISQIASAGGKHLTLPLKSKNPFVIMRNASRLAKIIKEYDVDIIHARSRAPAWSAYLAAKKTGCHYITTFHGVYSLGGYFKKLYNSSMVKGEKIIAISEFIKQHIIDNYGVDKKNITVIHRGVDLAQFDRAKLPENRIVQKATKLQIELDRPIILLPGRITRWKGHEFLLESLTNIPKDSYICLFVGDTEKHSHYVKSLQDKIIELELDNNIRIINNVGDMPALYSLADIVISASVRPEAFGRVAAEAQAMERLVIATNHGGARETIIDGKTGYLVEPGDVEGMEKTIRKLLKLTDRQRKTVTNRAKKHIQENFSLEKMTSQTLKLYKSVIKYKEED